MLMRKRTLVCLLLVPIAPYMILPLHMPVCHACVRPVERFSSIAQHGRAGARDLQCATSQFDP